MKSHYDILGISPTKNKEIIKKAYRKLSMVYHPDRPGGNKEKFIKIKEAYEALMEPDTTKIHQQYEHRIKPFVNVLRTHFNKKGNLDIFLNFSGVIHAETFAVDVDYKDIWTISHSKGGYFEVKKDYLEDCGYAFLIVFTTISGDTIMKPFVFTDPRSKFQKFKFKLKKLFS